MPLYYCKKKYKKINYVLKWLFFFYKLTTSNWRSSGTFRVEQSNLSFPLYCKAAHGVARLSRRKFHETFPSVHLPSPEKIDVLKLKSRSFFFFFHFLNLICFTHRYVAVMLPHELILFYSIQTLHFINLEKNSPL